MFMDNFYVDKKSYELIRSNNIEEEFIELVNLCVSNMKYFYKPKFKNYISLINVADASEESITSGWLNTSTAVNIWARVPYKYDGKVSIMYQDSVVDTAMCSMLVLHEKRKIVYFSFFSENSIMDGYVELLKLYCGGDKNESK